ncbi:MAG: ABC transporter permease [Oscillospiraceae bacterium]|nr:ABC transporter permease [Oscillospiraceae bacterium]
MKLTDLLRMGCVNLWRRKTRTLLTALSMTIGVMCIVVLISIGIGFERAFHQSLAEVGSLTKIHVTPDISARDTVSLLNDRAVEAIGSLDAVEAVTPVIQASAFLRSGRYVHTRANLYGIDLSTADRFMLIPKRGLLPTEGARMRPEVMVTEDLGERFQNPNDSWNPAVDADGDPLIDPLYANIRLTFDFNSISGEQIAGPDGRAVQTGDFYQLNVAGVSSTQNGAFMSSVFLDMIRLQEWIDANAPPSAPETMTREARVARAAAEAGGMTYDLVWVKVREIGDVQWVAQVIQEAGFNTYSLNDVLDAVNTQARQVQGLLGAVGAVAMIASAFGVANTMTMSITERTREVGILKVLGTELGDIAKIFLTEAAIVGILGGALGLGLSFLVQRLLPFIELAEMDLYSVIPPWLALGAILFAGAVALAAALLPAVRAMRISPLEAIRTQ